MNVWIEINGIGGELVIHPISESTFQFWNTKSKEQLLSYVLQDSHEPVPENFDFVLDASGLPRQWHELDGYLHVYGPDPRNVEINVDIFTNGRKRRVISDETLHSATFKMKSKIKTSLYQPPTDIKNTTNFAVQIVSVEKGCLFGGAFEASCKKDFEKLIFKTVKIVNTEDSSVEMILSAIHFNDEALENVGLSTTGKGLFANLLKFKS